MKLREQSEGVTAGAVKQYLAEIGRKGGSAARGDKKRRSPEHYKKMVEARRKKRKKKVKDERPS